MKKLLFLILAIVAMAGCAKDQIDYNSNIGGELVFKSAAVASVTTVGKADGGETGEPVNPNVGLSTKYWQLGDAIGVYLDNTTVTNVLGVYTYSQYVATAVDEYYTATFTGYDDSSILALSGSNTNIYAYAPYYADLSSDGSYSYDANYPVDLLVAKIEGVDTQSTGNATALALEFDHALAMFEFSVVNMDGTPLGSDVDPDDEEATYPVLGGSIANFSSRGTYNLLTKEISGLNEAIYTVELTRQSTTSHILEGIILPQENLGLKLGLSLDGLTYSKLDIFLDVPEFEAGKKYSVTCYIEADVIVLVSESVTAWTVDDEVDGSVNEFSAN